MAHKLPPDDEDKHKEEVAILLGLFKKLVSTLIDDDNEWSIMEDMMMARADHLIHHALSGFGITFEEAIDIIKNDKVLTTEQANQRKIILAAIDNLVDFAVAEEYQMFDSMMEIEELLSEDESEDMDYEEWLELYLPIFSKFNDRYAKTENKDVEYAMIMAAYLAALENETVLTYMTMGDERVRPWHLQYEGYSAPKSRFPAWLIPPIEHQCRCYLVEDTASIMGQIKAEVIEDLQMPDWFNRTFKESVAFGGRIFSDEHPYFLVDERHIDRLKIISNKIKDKYLR